MLFELFRSFLPLVILRFNNEYADCGLFSSSIVELTFFSYCPSLLAVFLHFVTQPEIYYCIVQEGIDVFLRIETSTRGIPNNSNATKLGALSGSPCICLSNLFG